MFSLHVWWYRVFRSVSSNNGTYTPASGENSGKRLKIRDSIDLGERSVFLILSRDYTNRRSCCDKRAQHQKDLLRIKSFSSTLQCMYPTKTSNSKNHNFNIYCSWTRIRYEILEDDFKHRFHGYQSSELLISPIKNINDGHSIKTFRYVLFSGKVDS